MDEKVTLLPSAPTDDRLTAGPLAPPPVSVPAASQTSVPMPRIIIAPGLELDTTRKFRYGLHSLCAAGLIFASFIFIELRDCNWSPGINLDTLQALHVCLMVFAFVLYLLSLFGIADYIFQFRLLFFFGVLATYVAAALMVWMSWEAATNPCVKTTNFVPIDLTVLDNKNVFSRGDGVGIIVLLMDIFATILMVSAASNFARRH